MPPLDAELRYISFATSTTGALSKSPSSSYVPTAPVKTGTLIVTAFRFRKRDDETTDDSSGFLATNSKYQSARSDLKQWTADHPKDFHGLLGGAIAAGVLLLLAIGLCCVRRYKKKKKQVEEMQNLTGNPNPYGASQASLLQGAQPPGLLMGIPSLVPPGGIYQPKPQVFMPMLSQGNATIFR